MDIYMPIFTDKAPGDVFWFRPVAPRAGEPIDWEDVVWLGNGFSIEEDGVDCYLAHFLERFFDADLPANQGREAYGQGFEWNLTHNFLHVCDPGCDAEGDCADRQAAEHRCRLCRSARPQAALCGVSPMFSGGRGGVERTAGNATPTHRGHCGFLRPVCRPAVPHDAAPSRNPI